MIIDLNMKKYLSKASDWVTLKKRKGMIENFSPEKYICGFRYSDGIMKFMEQKGEDWRDAHLSYIPVIQKLIEVRNELLTISHRIGEYEESNDISLAYTKDDYLKASKMVQVFYQRGILAPHYMYDLPIRDQSSETYTGCELSDSEEI